MPALARQPPKREGHRSEEWAGPVAVMINGKEGHLLVLLGRGHDLALWTPGLQPGEALSRGPACWAWAYPQRSRILRAYSAKPPSAAVDRHTMKNTAVLPPPHHAPPFLPPPSLGRDQATGPGRRPSPPQGGGGSPRVVPGEVRGWGLPGGPGAHSFHYYYVTIVLLLSSVILLHLLQSITAPYP